MHTPSTHIPDPSVILMSSQSQQCKEPAPLFPSSHLPSPNGQPRYLAARGRGPGQISAQEEPEDGGRPHSERISIADPSCLDPETALISLSRRGYKAGYLGRHNPAGATVSCESNARLAGSGGGQDCDPTPRSDRTPLIEWRS